MKNQKIFNIAAGIALTLGATACSSDYLDLKPDSNMPYQEVINNEEGATLAVHGLCGSMYTQYSALYDYNWFNGEPWLGSFYGDVMGQDYISLFWFLSYPGIVNWTQMDQVDSFGAQVAWSYCYGLISQANNVITFVPKRLDDDGKEVMFQNSETNAELSPDISATYQFRVAQALTMRAHGYTRLMQIYAPRWDERFDVDGNAKNTVPLRLKFEDPEGNTDCPLSSMEAVMDQIYLDLDQALALYTSSRHAREYNWEPDIQIAKGIYARAALLRNDYAKARQMAKEAREGYTLMNSLEYQAGFAEPTSEWMWTNSGMAQGVYYASFGATYACNGSYPCLWGNIGAGAIDNELLKQAATNDRRAAIFFAPRNVLGNAKKALFWNAEACNEKTLDINDETGALHSDFVQFCRNRYNAIGQDDWYPPYTYMGNMLGESTTTVTAQFGAQFKFWGTDGYATSYYPFMRASEMLLIEAECAYQLGDEAGARALINELQRNRYSGTYRDITTSGTALYDAIKVCRRLELWGEGFNWFDFKRWGDPITRKEWVAGDEDSGNWPISVAGDYDTKLSRGWRWRIPRIEFNYNHAIDQTEATAKDDLTSDEVLD